MTSPAFVDVPGLNFDWLNLDTEQGMRIQAGRKGLTLEQINALTYGNAEIDASGAPVFKPRGAWADPRSPRHARQYRSKADVWSESAMLLYEEANQRQWSSAVDIPWETIQPLPDDLEWAMCTLCTFLTQVEFIAGDLPGRFMEQVHPDHFESQLFLGTQIMDESRHLDVFRKRALVNGGGMVDAGFGAINLLSVDDFTEMTALLHLVGEGFVQTLFRMGELIAQNEAEKKIFRLAAQDESRHLAFGVTHMKYVMDTEPWRKEEMHHYLDIQEGALAQSQQASLTTNPTTGEALAILAGGGIEHIDEGYAKLMLMRKRQVNEYMHRLEVIGLGDRRERMAPGLREFLDPVN
ncbi:ferritin-like domain-containing protein [Tepidiforma flava]|uniref:Ferritin-like domain-containing protein n=1 Tax=Tepidiforma flava TaxID=3004094 RepID=A0ABY7M3D3_9CHLR|nr:ferritin-like domain-containing protein [Tepidiforma flava]WBL34862.1 ferritin-like domain-containing protein [Tepidiforma flava]